eukprot:1362670-Karenia_brevis.AAC.1
MACGCGTCWVGYLARVGSLFTGLARCTLTHKVVWPSLTIPMRGHRTLITSYSLRRPRSCVTRLQHIADELNPADALTKEAREAAPQYAVLRKRMTMQHP